MIFWLVLEKVIGYHDIKESFVDAKRALDYINVVRKVVGDSKRSIVDCSKLGFFQVFAEIKDKKNYGPISRNLCK